MPEKEVFLPFLRVAVNHASLNCTHAFSMHTYVHLTCMQELFPGTFQPTPGHYFIKLLHDMGLLQRCFTQNIDSLEHQAGLPKQQIVAAHGNFDSESWHTVCARCQKALQ